MHLKKTFFPIVILFTLFTFSCQDDDGNNNIPLVEVNFIVQLNDPDFINLKTIGGWVYVTGGSRGILLFRSDQNIIKAYDRHCTFQSSNTCALVSVDPTNITATDDCCGSSFLLLNGSVSRPPANFPLKQYNTDFQAGRNSFRVFN